VAAVDCTFLAVQKLSPFVVPSDFLADKILCSRCGWRFIIRPEGAGPLTRYTCPACCNSLWKSRDKTTTANILAIAEAIDARCWRETAFAGDLGVTSENSMRGEL